MKNENDITGEFERCIERKLMRDGTHLVCCKLGLWSVGGMDREQVERESRHYWAQYFADGEYVSMTQPRH